MVSHLRLTLLLICLNEMPTFIKKSGWIREGCPEGGGKAVEKGGEAIARSALKEASTAREKTFCPPLAGRTVHLGTMQGEAVAFLVKN